jgi:ABC-type multidrug transport system ATPase subunit
MDSERRRVYMQQWRGVGYVSYHEHRGLELIGSLGGSGSGKTTLLNAVAHRLGGLPVEDGEVAYFASTGETAGDKLGRGEVKRRLGFVRQQDFLVECLTGRSPHFPYR